MQHTLAVGVGAEVASVVMEGEGFDQMDAPVERVCGAEVPMPYARTSGFFKECIFA